MKNLLKEIKVMNRIAGTQLTKEQEITLIRERLEQLNELEFGTQKAGDMNYAQALKKYGQSSDQPKSTDDIKEDSQINEAERLTDRIVELYNAAGFKTTYDQKYIKRFGADAVKKAIEMTPKILALKEEMVSFAKEVYALPEAKLLIKLMHEKSYTGNSRGLMSDIGFTFMFLHQVRK